MEFRIGTSGFYNRHWKGLFYPPGLPQREWFRYYCTRFKTIELNVSFYRFPSEPMLAAWYEKSPYDFLFSVKAPRLITHFRSLRDCEQLLEDFYQACRSGLKEKLACLLFQFPPQFGFSEEKLELIANSMNPDFINVLEFRDAGWWNASVFDTFKKRNLVFCAIDHPTMPHDLVCTSTTLYLRLHGSPSLYYSSYNGQYLNDLKQSINNQRVETAYVYFNNTAGDAGIQNAITLNEMVHDGHFAS